MFVRYTIRVHIVTEDNGTYALEETSYSLTSIKAIAKEIEKLGLSYLVYRIEQHGQDIQL